MIGAETTESMLSLELFFSVIRTLLEKEMFEIQKGL